jgi:hypothetical protein
MKQAERMDENCIWQRMTRKGATFENQLKHGLKETV